MKYVNFIGIKINKIKYTILNLKDGVLSIIPWIFFVFFFIFY
jgi:hypothetical protein